MNTAGSIRQIIEKVFNNSATAEELEELIAAFKGEHRELILEEMEKISSRLPASGQWHTGDGVKWSKMADSILQSDGLASGEHRYAATRVPVYKMPVFRYVAAACIILLIATLFYASEKSQTDKEPNNQKTLVQSMPAEEVLPGGNHAVLQLSDGSIISLDSFKTGPIARQGTASVLKRANGEIVYEPGNGPELLFNTLITPRGGQYQLMLPDGTKAWLNAASSIRYPVHFNGRERKVETKGEVYFEVARDTRKPFVVNAAGGMEILVLGTRFNVNTYNEEKYIRTTLLEGSVSIKTTGNTRLMKPGQQAVADRQGGLSMQENADLEAVLAWQKGLFNFNKSGIKEIMNQLARWYDIDIKYQGAVKDQLYGGEMHRDLNLSQVLKMLEKSGVRFQLQNKTLTVMP